MKNVHEIEIKVEGKEWEDAITKSFNKNVQNVKLKRDVSHIKGG